MYCISRGEKYPYQLTYQLLRLVNRMSQNRVTNARSTSVERVATKERLEGRMYSKVPSVGEGGAHDFGVRDGA